MDRSREIPIGFRGVRLSRNWLFIFRINETEIRVYTPWFGIWIGDGAFEFERLVKWSGMELNWWRRKRNPEGWAQPFYRFTKTWTMRREAM